MRMPRLPAHRALRELPDGDGAATQRRLAAAPAASDEAAVGACRDST
jgi:hypothetical protein